MRVVINQLPALKRKTGIGHYTSQLLRCLAEQSADEIDVFPSEWWRNVVTRARNARGLLRRNGGPALVQDTSRPTENPFKERAWDLLRSGGRALLGKYFRHVAGKQGYQLYHEPNFIPFPSDLPTVATVCDLSVLLHPEWHPADRVKFYEKHFQEGIARAHHLIAISEFGRQEIIATLGIAPAQVTRTYMGIFPGLGPLPPEVVQPQLAALGLPPSYLLCLGTLEPRKNLRMLLEAYLALPDALRNRMPLVLAGGWGWNTKELAAFLHDEARHRGVIHVGYVGDEHLGVLYNGARCLVYPSLYEGFGLPPVEMQACGGAVLASTAGAVAETVGSQACLIDPHDVDGWRRAMGRVIEDDEWWRSQRLGAEQSARRYTWENCAAETLRVYRKLCGAEVATPQPLRRAG